MVILDAISLVETEVQSINVQIKILYFFNGYCYFQLIS